jgi:hypothetical protein
MYINNEIVLLVLLFIILKVCVVVIKIDCIIYDYINSSVGPSG